MTFSKVCVFKFLICYIVDGGYENRTGYFLIIIIIIIIIIIM